MTATPHAPAAPTARPGPPAPRPAVLLAFGAGLLLLGAIVPALVLRLTRARPRGRQRVHGSRRWRCSRSSSSGTRGGSLPPPCPRRAPPPRSR